MNVTRNLNGSWVLNDSEAAGYLVTRVYYGYTKREAIRLFHEYLRATFTPR